MYKLLLVLLVIFLIWQNNGLVITRFSYSNMKIPRAFKGFRIVQISDLHNKNFYGRLSRKIKYLNPDIIIITGDIIDRRRMNLSVATNFLRKVRDIDIYYVSGNHEHLSGKYQYISSEIENLGVNILDNRSIDLEKHGDVINIMGIADPTICQKSYASMDNSKYIKNIITELNKKNSFNILLSHRPEEFETYVNQGVDLVFTGHAHGGQFRIPFIGGLFAPRQGLFPKYSEGIIKKGKTSMVVNRGLGNSLFPIRLFNRPEIIVLDLKET